MRPFARLLLVLALIAPVFASSQSATPLPTCNLYASATRVAYNTKVKLTWSTTNATSGYLTEVGVIASSGSAYVVPGKNTTYAASFTGLGGSVVCRVGIAVGGGSAPVPINTGAPIDTNAPVNTSPQGGGRGGAGGPAADNGGGGSTGPNIPDLTFPTAQSVAPSTQGGSGFVGGIVPAECRGRSTVANCDLCSLAQMVQNLAYFLLGLTIPAAALLFAWAGILYFSARGNPGQIEKAHKVFKTVAIGFIIALSAWVLIGTVMSMLVHGGDIKSWDWRNLNCEQTRKARLYDMNLSQYLTTSLPLLSSGPIGGSGIITPPPGGGCDADLGYCWNSAGQPTIDTETGAYVNNPSAGPGGTCANGSSYWQYGSDAGTASCIDDDGNVSYPASNSSLASAYANYSSEQKILLDACSKGDISSCSTFSSGAGSGELGQRIAQAVDQYKDADTSMGPDGGNKACAWAINNILAASGIAPIDGSSVEMMQKALEAGRGSEVNQSQAQPGDIVVWKTNSASHVGVVNIDAHGNLYVHSNSSGDASFSNISGFTFKGVEGKVYHVNN